MKTIQPGDIWIVEFPYITAGNMVKKRPAIILKELDNNNYLLQKLTTSYKPGRKRLDCPSFYKDKRSRKTFISTDKVVLNEYYIKKFVCKYKREEDE